MIISWLQKAFAAQRPKDTETTMARTTTVTKDYTNYKTWYFMNEKKQYTALISTREYAEAYAAELFKQNKITHWTSDPPNTTWYYYKEGRIVKEEWCSESYANRLGIALFNRREVDSWDNKPLKTNDNSPVWAPMRVSDKDEWKRETVTVETKTETKSYSYSKKDTTNDKYFVAFDKVPSWNRVHELNKFFPKAKEKFEDKTYCYDGM